MTNKILYEIAYGNNNPDRDIVRLIDDLEQYPVQVKSRSGRFYIAYDIPEQDLTYLKLKHPFITIRADVYQDVADSYCQKLAIYPTI